MLFTKLCEVLHVNLTVRQTLDHFYTKPSEYRRGWIGAMCTLRNKTNITVTLLARFVVGTNAAQTSVFAMGTTQWLNRTGRHSSNRTHLFLEVNDEVTVPLCLIDGYVRVQEAVLWPQKCLQGWDRVQLHRTRAEWNHAMCQAIIFSL